MTKNISRLLPIAFVVALVTMYACKKETPLTIPAEQAHFTFRPGGSYFITAPGVTYKVPVGLTSVSGSDRTVSVTITSPTGAVQGTHYTVNKTTLTIPAGKATDTILVTGNYSQYTTGRKDSLVFTINGTDKGSSVAAFESNKVFKLFMRGPCAEQEILTDILSLNGAYGAVERGYNPTTGALGYSASYASNASGATITGPTTAEIIVSNIWEMGQAVTAKINLDFSDFADRKATVAGEQYLGPGTLVSSTWSTYSLFIVPIGAVQPQPAAGNYTFCGNSVIFFKYRILVKDAASGTPLGYAAGASGITSYTHTMTKP